MRHCFSNWKLNLLFLLIIIGITMMIPGLSLGKTSKDAHDMRGRWGGIKNLNGEESSFTMLFAEFNQHPDEPGVLIAGGCISFDDLGVSTPVSVQADSLGNGKYYVIILGTEVSGDNTSIIKFEGTLELSKNLKDDVINGDWFANGESETWYAYHHDRRNAACPAVGLEDDGLYLTPDVYGLVFVDSANGGFENAILEGHTNIVSSALQVELPDGSIMVVPYATDVFSPEVNFINNFRFGNSIKNLPVENGVYTFTLLDVNGHPIEGTAVTDTWLGIIPNAPRDVLANTDNNGDISVSWDPVDVSLVGFFQMELFMTNPWSETLYGSAGMLIPEHIIPFASFGGESAYGNPDGFDFGKSLDELDDGAYAFDVITFSVAPDNSGAKGIECQIRDADEQVRFEKANGVIIITN